MKCGALDAVPNGRHRSNHVADFWLTVYSRLQAIASHPDPLAEAGNWIALTIGSHLPFWPLYVFWEAGWGALPSSLLTAAMTPAFLLVPAISRRSSYLSRVATPLMGIANTIFTIWILGMNSGTEIFLVPCAALAAFILRRTERLTMLVLSTLPLIVWYLLQYYPPTALHQYDAEIARHLLVLNVSSIGFLFVLIGWLQADIYRRMEHVDN